MKFLGSVSLPPDCRIADIISLIKEKMAAASEEHSWNRIRVAAVREIAKRRENAKIAREKTQIQLALQSESSSSSSPPPPISSSPTSDYLLFDHWVSSLKESKEQDPQGNIKIFHKFSASLQSEMTKFMSQLSSPSLQNIISQWNYDFNLLICDEDKGRNGKNQRFIAEQFASDVRISNGTILICQIAFSPAELDLFKDYHFHRYKAYEDHLKMKLYNINIPSSPSSPSVPPFDYSVIPTHDFYETGLDFLYYVNYRYSVRFRRLPWTTNPPKDKNSNFEFTLDMTSNIPHQTILHRVADIINVEDHTRIQLHKHSQFSKTVDHPVDKFFHPTSQQPYLTLYEMIDRGDPILYYSLLDFSTNELKTNFHVNSIYCDKKLQYSIHRELIPKSSNFRTLQEKIQRKIYPNVPIAELPKCRRMLISYDFFIKRQDFGLDQSIAEWRRETVTHLHPEIPILIEEISEEEEKKDPTDTVHSIYRFLPASLSFQYKFYSVPFTMTIKQGESAPQFMKRLQKRLNISDPKENNAKEIAKHKERISGMKLSRLTAQTFYDLSATVELKIARDRRRKQEKNTKGQSSLGFQSDTLDEELLTSLQIEDIDDLEWGGNGGGGKNKNQSENDKGKGTKSTNPFDESENEGEGERERESKGEEKGEGEGEHGGVNVNLNVSDDGQVKVNTENPKEKEKKSDEANSNSDSPTKSSNSSSSYPSDDSDSFLADDSEYPYLLVSDHTTIGLGVYDPVHLSEWESLTGQAVTMATQNNYNYFMSIGKEKDKIINTNQNQNQNGIQKAKSLGIKFYNKE